MARPPGKANRNRLIGLAAAVVLVVAMIASTKFLTPAELAEALPKPFDPKQTAADLFSKAQAELPGNAAPLGEVIVAIQTDPKAAAAKFKAVSPAESSYVFPVKATGTVTEATPANLTLKVPGAPAPTPVLVPLGTAVNGTALRDVMGFKFADAPGQTAYQYVGDELKKLMQGELQAAGDPASLKGKQVTVVGAVTVQGSNPVPKPKPINIQPLSLKAGS